MGMGQGSGANFLLLVESGLASDARPNFQDASSLCWAFVGAHARKMIVSI